MSVIVGDCLEVMRTLEAGSFDSIVTDPPYGLGFMGKGWDHAVPGEPYWREALRVAKPGAYLAAFGGTRTFHRMACAIEDAGWELRDTLMWVYGSGFPKSRNIGGGWGTALKPAWEPIVLARKPLSGTVAANVERWGTGALNIDGCRVEGPKGECTRGAGGQNGRYGPIGAQGFIADDGRGRWPANLVHDGSDEVLAEFPDAPGQQGDLTGNERTRPAKNAYGDMGAPREFKARRDGEASAARRYTQQGGTNFAPLPGMRREATSAARFFYCAKASRADRNDGCDAFAERPTAASEFRPNHTTKAAEGHSGLPYGRWRPVKNNHPTVKPTDLMRWLCRLVTPTGGLVLDPFAGSGSTGRGAIAEGFRFVGIELDPDYARIAVARIRAVQPGLALEQTA